VRVIKFRQLVNGRWHYFGYIDNAFIGPIEIENQTTGQFTGLLDKEGREIFESDIIKYSYSTDYDKYKQRKDPRKYVIGFIKWKNTIPGFTLMISRGPNKVVNWNEALERSSLLEIIGNIYENPELLKA